VRRGDHWDRWDRWDHCDRWDRWDRRDRGDRREYPLTPKLFVCQSILRGRVFCQWGGPQGVARKAWSASRLGVEATLAGVDGDRLGMWAPALRVTHIVRNDAHLANKVNTSGRELTRASGLRALRHTPWGYMCSFLPPWRRCTEILCTQAAKNFRVEPWRVQISASPARRALAPKTRRTSGLRWRKSLRIACFRIEVAHLAVPPDDLPSAHHHQMEVQDDRALTFNPSHELG